MDISILVLRVIHIFAGVFWAGAALMIAGFVEPTVRSLGPDGGKFIQRMVGQFKFSVFMSIAALVTTLAGVLLYWRVSGGLQLAWFTTSAAVYLTIGGLAGVAAFLLGLVVNGPTATRMEAVSREMQSAGGPPKPELLVELRGLQKRLRWSGVGAAVLLAISVIGMALV